MYKYSKITKTTYNNLINTMEVIIKDNQLIIKTESETIHFNFSKIVDSNLKYENGFIIKCDQFLAEQKIKTKLMYRCIAQI